MEVRVSDSLLLTPSSWTDDIRRKNPLDQAGRSAAVLAQMQSLGVDAGESICPECGEPLHLCLGDEIAPYLAHACSDTEHRCTGSFETAWHLAAKRAASRLPGWLPERDYTAGRRFRADCINKDTGECLEFVHTLSRDYLGKHVATKESGRSVAWVFDGNAKFCRRLDDSHWAIKSKVMMRFDAGYAESGQLVARGILRKRARQLVQSLGVESCFLHFHGMAFQCFDCGEERDDMWSLCQKSSLVARVVYGDGGLNQEIIHQRASGADVVHRGLGTNHTPDDAVILQEVQAWAWLIRERKSQQAACMSRESEKVAGDRGSLWVSPEDWPGDLVNLSTQCRCGSKFGVDVPIHGGQSARRDCAQCNKFLMFSRWYGKVTHAH
jgi:hypothetical protein